MLLQKVPLDFPSMEFQFIPMLTQTTEMHTSMKEKREILIQINFFSFDQCRGHASPSPTGGLYHYHAEPAPGCVYTDVNGQHSPLFAIMYDGVPMYGVKGDNGVVPNNLDECNGHVDNTHAYYHYHLQANLTYPYTINCLKGCLENTSPKINGEVCNASSTQYNYDSLKTQLNAVTKIFSCDGVTPLPPVSGDSSMVSFSLLILLFVAINLLL
jgi:hypothetical protein